MNHVRLIFGTHNHRPHGEFDHVCEAAYQKAYKPFLSILNRHPAVKAVAHFSGSLLTWIEENHAEYFMLLEEMVSRKQIELLGGGFYEPVLPVIPRSDRLGQIELLTTYLRSHFGVRPRGCWVAEGVWEPTLPYFLRNAGLSYTFLQESQFRIAGVPDDMLHVPHITEDQGKIVSVYPMSRCLSDLVGKGTPQEAIQCLEGYATREGKHVVSLMDDGERWGDLDERLSVLQKEGWIDRFLGLVEENQEWIETVHPSRDSATAPLQGRAYFRCSCQEDITQWMATGGGLESAVAHQRGRKRLVAAGRSTADAGVLIPGGFFRQFMQRYRESNLLYSKMMYTHLLVNQIRGDKYRKKAAKDELWKGQANDAYWHGEVGGIYHNHLRKAAYRGLIEAEGITRNSNGFIPSIISVDFDMDGSPEYLYQGADMNAYVHEESGMLFELDLQAVSWNYLDTLSRTPEPYHDSTCPEDWYCRKSFVDHFLDEKTTLDAFDAMRYRERGDFVGGRYECLATDRERFTVSLRREGRVRCGTRWVRVSVEKLYRFRKTDVHVSYHIANMSSGEAALWFAPEINVALASDSMESSRVSVIAPDREEIGCDHAERKGAREVLVQDLVNRVDIVLSAREPFDLWSLPVRTRSRTPSGMESIYQSSCLLPHWKLVLGPGQVWKEELCLSLKKR